jgi:putative Holliday junction resolvase
VTEQGAVGLVIGLPRGLDGQETAQTRAVREFAEQLKPAVQLPYYWQDEAVTSRQAEEELKSRGKPYQKGDIDALSATYILEDFLRDHPELTA